MVNQLTINSHFQSSEPIMLKADIDFVSVGVGASIIIVRDIKDTELTSRQAIRWEIARGAEVTLVSLNSVNHHQNTQQEVRQESRNTIHEDSHEIFVENSGTLRAFFLDCGNGSLARSCTTFLCDSNATAIIHGISMLSGKAQFSTNIHCMHQAPKTHSAVLWRMLLAQETDATYQGSIVLSDRAQGAYAWQDNKNMLLSHQARAISIPTIEVHTDEVQCKHGSATGYIDEAALQYLQMRGIEEYQARLLLIEGFISSAIDASWPALVIPLITHRIQTIMHSMLFLQKGIQ